MKIGLDLAEILRISKLDWRDGGGKKEKGRRRGGILLCNGLIAQPKTYFFPMLEAHIILLSNFKLVVIGHFK